MAFREQPLATGFTHPFLPLTGDRLWAVTNKRPPEATSEGVKLRGRNLVDYYFWRRNPIKPAKPMPASASEDGSGVGSDAQMDTWLMEPT